MKQGAGLGQATRELFDCPSCGTKIEATLSFSLIPQAGALDGERSSNPLEEATAVYFSQKLTGVTINHVCADNKPIPQRRAISDSPQA